MPTGRMKAPKCNWREAVIAAADPRFDPSAWDFADQSHSRQASRPVLLETTYSTALVLARGPDPSSSPRIVDDSQIQIEQPKLADYASPCRFGARGEAANRT